MKTELELEAEKYATEEFVNMIPSDNTPISFSAYLKMQVISGKTPELYDKFGSDWYTHNVPTLGEGGVLTTNADAENRC